MLLSSPSVDRHTETLVAYIHQELRVPFLINSLSKYSKQGLFLLPIQVIVVITKEVEIMYSRPSLKAKIYIWGFHESENVSGSSVLCGIPNSDTWWFCYVHAKLN